MSQERLQKLEALLTRVQTNRKTSRTIAGMPSPVLAARPSPAPNRTAALMPQPRPSALGVRVPPTPGLTESAARAESMAPKHADVSRASPTFGQPAPKQSLPPAPPAEAMRTRTEGSVAAAAPRPAEPAAPAMGREVPVSAVSAPGPAPLAGSREAPRVAAAMPAVIGVPPEPFEAPISSDEVTELTEPNAIEPTVIEPEPMREPARPIAQVVSRHAPAADATFGAMLKRSLSLRPH